MTAGAKTGSDKKIRKKFFYGVSISCNQAFLILVYENLYTIYANKFGRFLQISGRRTYMF